MQNVSAPTCISTRFSEAPIFRSPSVSPMILAICVTLDRGRMHSRQLGGVLRHRMARDRHHDAIRRSEAQQPLRIGRDVHIDAVEVCASCIGALCKGDLFDDGTQRHSGQRESDGKIGRAQERKVFCVQNRQRRPVCARLQPHAAVVRQLDIHWRGWHVSHDVSQRLPTNADAAWQADAGRKPLHEGYFHVRRLDRQRIRISLQQDSFEDRNRRARGENVRGTGEGGF